MMYYKPYLKLQRLVVIGQNGQIGFDEKFMSKLNIIRGTNSSGKSTISNFIFYVLGGDFNNWTTEASKADSVIAEISVNDSIFTLRRLVTQNSQQPMYVYWGKYEDSNSSEGWQIFPYRQTDNQRSFSNILFSTLNMPELKNDNESNITLNQILRLIYIDQKSPTLSLFKHEDFDSPLTRKAITELLFGIYDNDLYNDRLSLRDLNRTFDDKKKETHGILQIYAELGNKIDINEIEMDIQKAEEELKDVQNKLKEIKEKEHVVLDSRKKLVYTKLKYEIINEKHAYSQILEDIKKYEYDIEDSNYFIESLIKRKKSLDDSSLIRENLGYLKITHCPNCLSPLEDSSINDICFLCKNPINKNEEQSTLSRMGIELENQIKESKKLLEEKKEKLKGLNLKTATIIENIKRYQRNIDEILEEVRSTRDSETESLYVKKGQLEAQIQFLGKELNASNQLKLLKEELLKLEKEINLIKDKILLAERKQNERYGKSLATIEKYTLLILKKDLERQDEFKYGLNVELSPTKDTFTLDGKNNFSESSNTLLKNAVRFGIFFASLELDFFRYPRFIICDNTEDKGMEEIRSQRFQENILELSSKFDVEHQIILTTSMISSDMNNDELCIGEEYSVNNKTLKFND
ncbi:MAG: AAA family ATPase [Ignavibacteriae bacterium]|nr:AAA family ATPase [Ignavibacteriota bacterium]